MTLRPLRALREINASISELQQADVRAREEARVELARSATAYSAKARQVVDGTMSLSAVLMRAGEVGEAERLLAEVERDVRQEKEVLLETVQEANVATRDRRHTMSRLRLAKMFATALLGASVFIFSAMGVALATYFKDLIPPLSQGGSATFENVDGRYEVSPARRISFDLGHMRLELSPAQYDKVRQLISSDPDKLRSFLLSILPSELAGELDRALERAGITPAITLAGLDAAAEGAVKDAPKAEAPSGSTASSSDGEGTSQNNSNGGQKKSDDGAQDDDPTSGSSGCEDDEEGHGEEQNSMGFGPLDGCVPLLDDEEEDD